MCCTESVRRNLAVLCSSCIVARYQRLSKNSSHGVSLRPQNRVQKSAAETRPRNRSIGPQSILKPKQTLQNTLSRGHITAYGKRSWKPARLQPTLRRVFCYRVRPESVYNSICGRQRNVQTSDSDRGLEIGRARPDRAARIMWHTGTMVCWLAGVLRQADATCIIHIHILYGGV